MALSMTSRSSERLYLSQTSISHPLKLVLYTPDLRFKCCMFFHQHTGAIKEWQYVALHKTPTLHDAQNCAQGFLSHMELLESVQHKNNEMKGKHLKW